MKAKKQEIRVNMVDLSRNQVDTLASKQARSLAPNYRREVSGIIFINVCWLIQQHVGR